MQDSRCGLSSAEIKGRITSLIQIINEDVEELKMLKDLVLTPGGHH